jgi:hypothetical protein
MAFDRALGDNANFECAFRRLKMKHALIWFVSFVIFIFLPSVVFCAYHHAGEEDSDKFLAAYPDKAGTKLDHCALCHTGGQYEKKPGKWVSLGSCQWCHYKYGYDGSGNIIDTLNEYGKDYLVNGRNQAAITAIDNEDSDEDGYANAVEIDALRFPGNPNDDPTKKTAPYKIYTKAQLEAMTVHTQFLLMNTNRSGDFYAEYTGVVMEDLLEDAGLLDEATGIFVYAPDGFSTYHPIDEDPDPSLYHVKGAYPSADYYYHTEADADLGENGWCDYSAISCIGREHLDTIVNPDGNKLILAYKRENAYMDPGVLDGENRLQGEGPYRVVPPQKVSSPPDQSSTSEIQPTDPPWAYNEDWDHNAGYSSRTATIIKVQPLPPGTTDIDVFEAGWAYVDQEKVVVYGAIDVEPKSPSEATPADGATDVERNVGLTWEGGDPDPRESVTYDVYFGTSETPELVATDQQGTHYRPGLLESGTTFYWKVVARDQGSKETEGEIWQFSTGQAIRMCPTASMLLLGN